MCDNLVMRHIFCFLEYSIALHWCCWHFFVQSANVFTSSKLIRSWQDNISAPRMKISLKPLNKKKCFSGTNSDNKYSPSTYIQIRLHKMYLFILVILNYSIYNIQINLQNSNEIGTVIHVSTKCIDKYAQEDHYGISVCSYKW